MTTTYAHININSPWRWVPMIAGPLAFLPMDIAFRLGPDSKLVPLFYCVAFINVALVVFSAFRVGSGSAWSVAEREARASDRVRASSKPKLALGMLGLGVSMLVVWAVALATHALPRDTAAGEIVRSISFPIVGMFLAIYGAQRPWDLEVVEREKPATG